MKVHALIYRAKHLGKILKELQRQAHRDSLDSVEIGYTAAYAIYVHENVEMKWAGKPRRSGIGVYWGPAGQAKFLEEPARTMQPVLAQIVRTVYKKTKSMKQALLAAGLVLQRASQKLVPVEYGNLKASAFTRFVKGK